MDRSPPGMVRLELVAVEFRQIDQGVRPRRRPAEPIFAVLDKQAEDKAEGRVSRAGPRSSASPLSAAGRLRSASMARPGSPRVIRAAAAVHARMRPATSPAPFAATSSAAKYGEALLRGSRCRLDGRPRTARSPTYRLNRLLGGVAAPARAGEGQPCGSSKEATPRSANGLVAGAGHCARTSVFNSSST